MSFKLLLSNLHYFRLELRIQYFSMFPLIYKHEEYVTMKYHSKLFNFNVSNSKSCNSKLRFTIFCFCYFHILSPNMHFMHLCLCIISYIFHMAFVVCYCFIFHLLRIVIIVWNCFCVNFSLFGIVLQLFPLSYFDVNFSCENFQFFFHYYCIICKTKENVTDLLVLYKQKRNLMWNEIPRKKYDIKLAICKFMRIIRLKNCVPNYY